MGHARPVTGRLDGNMYVCMLEVTLAVLPMEKGNQLGQEDLFSQPLSKIGSRHTADRVLPPVGVFCGQLCSRPNGFAERLS